jgi:hypothetical protein
LSSLKKLGIDLDAITEKLQSDRVTAFIASFDQLLAAVEEKRKRNLKRGGELLPIASRLRLDHWRATLACSATPHLLSVVVDFAGDNGSCFEVIGRWR